MSTLLPSKEKQTELKQQMEKLGVLEKDLEESFVLGSGKGGQKQIAKLQKQKKKRKKRHNEKSI